MILLDTSIWIDHLGAKPGRPIRDEELLQRGIGTATTMRSPNSRVCERSDRGGRELSVKRFQSKLKHHGS